jgi:hypothetical protein
MNKQEKYNPDVNKKYDQIPPGTLFAVTPQ